MRIVLEEFPATFDNIRLKPGKVARHHPPLTRGRSRSKGARR
jgi:hypothetical protein